MKLSLIILAILVLTAVCVDRRHKKRRHTLKTKATNVLLCDAGSSKTECFCMDSNYVEKGKAHDDVYTLGSFYKGEVTVKGKTEKMTADMYKESIKKLRAGLDDCKTADIYLLSTAGSRAEIYTSTKIKPSNRDATDNKIRDALRSEFGASFKIFEVISGRFEGFFGYSDGLVKHGDKFGGKNMIYYECGGMSCQLAWEMKPNPSKECTNKFWKSLDAAVYKTGTRFSKTSKKVQKIKRAHKRTGGVMNLNKIDGSGKINLFSKSWLGTGAKGDALTSFKLPQEGFWAWVGWFFNTKAYKENSDKTVGDWCTLTDKATDMYTGCHDAIKKVFNHKGGSGDVIGEDMKPQSDAVRAQLNCEEFAHPKVLVQSKALNGALEKNYQRACEFDQMGLTKEGTTTYKISLGNLKLAAQKLCSKDKNFDSGNRFFAAGCVGLVHYQTLFKDVLGLADDVEVISATDINWIVSAHKWVSRNLASKDDTRWPYPDSSSSVNQEEDKIYTQA